jgi:pseudouridine synthase
VNERLNKVLAHAGIASRRAADQMILEGRVQVNGKVICELGHKVDPQHDAIKVDNKRIPSAPQSHTYLMLNKPRGYVTTLSDPEHRPTIRDLLHGVRARVFPVGRLDYQTEGLLLLTDDGDLARDLMHPGSGVSKTYSAKVRGTPEPAQLERLRRGIRIDGKATLPAEVFLKRRGPNSWIEVRIVEGRKHQVRLMFLAVGHPVLKLRRVAYGGLELGKLPSGQIRPLTSSEVDRLRRSVGAKQRRERPDRRKPRSGVIN